MDWTDRFRVNEWQVCLRMAASRAKRPSMFLIINWINPDRQRQTNK